MIEILWVKPGKPCWMKTKMDKLPFSCLLEEGNGPTRFQVWRAKWVWCVWGLCYVELILNNFNLGAFLLGGELAFHLDLFLWWLHWRCKQWQLSLPFWADWMVAWKLVMRTLLGLDQDVVVNYKIHTFCFMDWWQNVDGLKKGSTWYSSCMKQRICMWKDI